MSGNLRTVPKNSKKLLPSSTTKNKVGSKPNSKPGSSKQKKRPQNIDFGHQNIGTPTKKTTNNFCDITKITPVLIASKDWGINDGTLLNHHIKESYKQLKEERRAMLKLKASRYHNYNNRKHWRKNDDYNYYVAELL